MNPTYLGLNMRGLLKRCPQESILLGALVLIKLIIHLVLARDYGYFRDEFYYLQLGRHVFDGSTAMPLFAPLLMAFNQAILGDSLLAIHFWPAMAGAGVIVLTVLMVRELGGKIFAQALAGTCVLLAPCYLGINSTFSYDSFDQLLWVMCFYVLLRLLKYDDARRWLTFGLVAGLGLFTKESMLFLGFGVAVAFLITSQRHYYRTKWMWLGAVIALAFCVPYVVMQIKLNWPTLSYWGYYTQRKTYPVTPSQFFWYQVLIVNPLAFPVWLSGLFYALRSVEGRPYRPLGWTYLVLFIFFLLLKAKFYFLAPAYPFFFAAGAVQLAKWAQQSQLKWITWAYACLIVLSGTLLAPFGMPLLPVETFIKLAALGGTALRAEHERLKTNLLPQHFADRFGWENMAAQVSAVYRSLPPEDQRRACIFTSNYGEAGAIEFFNRRHDPGFPPVLSGHGQYFFWGCGQCTGELVITVGIPRTDLARTFATVTATRTIQSPYCMPYENNLTIYICRQIVRPLKELWPYLKHFD